jgi:hypothetical protein
MLGMLALFAVRPIGAAMSAGPLPQPCRPVKPLEGAPPGTLPSGPGETEPMPTANRMNAPRALCRGAKSSAAA